MKKDVLFILFFTLLLFTVGCKNVSSPNSDDSIEDVDDTTDNPLNEDSSAQNSSGGTNVNGVITIPNSLNIVSSGASRAAVADLTGNIVILIGDVELTIPAGSLEIDSAYIRAPFSQDLDFSGLVVITYFSELVYQGTAIEAAGTVMTVVNNGADNNINDTDGDGSVSSDEETGTFSDVSLTDTSLTGVPVIDAFSVSSHTSDSPVITFSASLSNMNMEFVTLKVNDSYRIIDLNLAGGACSVNGKELPLSPGVNEVQLIAINSNGVTKSGIESVTYNSQVEPGSQGLLFTLDWDTPTSDMDLHTYYYSDTSPTSSLAPAWHNYFGNMTAPLMDSELSSLPGDVSAISTIDGADTNISFDHASIDFDFYTSELEISLWSASDRNQFIDIEVDSTLSQLGVGSYALSGSGSFRCYNRYFDFTLTSGSINITAIDSDQYSGTITMSGSASVSGTPQGTFSTAISFNHAFNADSNLYSIANKLDVDDVYGYGPEHFTLNDAPDGYYVVAVNSYDLDSDPDTRCFVTIQTSEAMQVLGPYLFTESNGMDYPIEGSGSWYRVADIKVVNGKATILNANTGLNSNLAAGLGPVGSFSLNRSIQNEGIISSRK